MFTGREGPELNRSRSGTGPRASGMVPHQVQPGASGANSAYIGNMSTWTLLLRIWPIEDRPEEMTDPAVVSSLSFDQLIEYKKHYEALVKREGKGDGVFGKDCTIPTKRFEAGEDNCAELLHPARFQRAPILDRRKYWHLVPVKRGHTYRRLALEHCGADGKVSECVIVRAHDRSLPLKLKMFMTNNRAQKSRGSQRPRKLDRTGRTPG